MKTLPALVPCLAADFDSRDPDGGKMSRTKAVIWDRPVTRATVEGAPLFAAGFSPLARASCTSVKRGRENTAVHVVITSSTKSYTSPFHSSRVVPRVSDRPYVAELKGPKGDALPQPQPWSCSSKREGCYRKINYMTADVLHPCTSGIGTLSLR